MKLQASRRTWIAASLTGGAVLLATVMASRGSDARPCRSTLIPAYVSPGELGALAAEQPKRSRILIVNPASGPGAAPEAAYRDAVAASRAAGARVLGYVPTGYGARDPAHVRADVDRYESWYGTDGIFLDEAASGEEQLEHYRMLARHVRSAGDRLVVLNPGVVPDRRYFEVADIVVTYEGPFAAYKSALAAMPAWARELPAWRVAHLVYAASAELAAEAVRARSGAGYLYVTSGTLPNPWGTLPPYLGEQEALLGSCPAATA